MFEETKDTKAHNDATDAIRQLNRRDMIKIVYDPDLSRMEKARRKALGLPKEEESNMVDEELIDLREPSYEHKSKSVALPFGHL